MKLIGIAGTKRSGKGSSVKYIYGQILQKNDVIDKFEIDEDGNLIVPGEFEDGIRMARFDIERRDIAFATYAQECLWPYVKDYYFASFLKEQIHRMFDISYEQLNGTTEEKESDTPYTWGQSFPKVTAKYLKEIGATKDSFIKAREFVQNYADLIRQIDNEAFIRVTMEEINVDQTPVSIIGDVRTVSELRAIKNAGGKVIYLNRRDHTDPHKVESELVSLDPSEFDAVIDNSNMTIAEKNVEIHKICDSWGIFE